MDHLLEIGFETKIQLYSSSADEKGTLYPPSLKQLFFWVAKKNENNVHVP